MNERQQNLRLYLYHLEYKMLSGDGIYDFGRGGYDYKTTHFHPQMENLYRLMYSKSLLGNFLIIFRVCFSHFKKVLRNKLAK